MTYRAKLRVRGRKGSDALMAWDRVWYQVNSNVVPFGGITMRWLGLS